jgi:hypothetical protein
MRRNISQQTNYIDFFEYDDINDSGWRNTNRCDTEGLIKI